MAVAGAPADTSGVRIDVWLWAARFFKTRALAKDALGHGRVQVNGQRCKPSRLVRVGDEMEVRRGDERFEIQVLGLSDKRGPAPVAQALYLESEQSKLARAAENEQRRLAQAATPRPAGKPDKRDRRKLKHANEGRADGKLPPWFPQ
jgi:ribosome-associated heat shock protein Hsp15